VSRPGWPFTRRLLSPVRALVVGVAVMLALSASGPSLQGPLESSQAPTIEPAQSARQPQRGGRLYVLSDSPSMDIDPAYVYSPEMAFLGATLMRSLVSYTYSPDPEIANTLQPDLATDTGTPNADATQWTFRLRDGPTWQDGTPVTCDDIKYGISRLFATDAFAGGPSYAIQYLDIPTEADGSSAYRGPYDGNGQELYDRAVVCTGSTITFHLNRTVTDFRYATTWGMVPVKRSADTGETYGHAGSPPPNFVSSGPYQIRSYTTGVGGSMILERNPYWDPASDPIRKALPDTWEVDFGLDPEILDQRLMSSYGEDAMAVMTGALQPENLPTIFADPETPNPDFAGRAFSAPSPFVLYYWINTEKVPSQLHRQAIAVALDRDGIRVNAGGVFNGALADGVIPPSLGLDYAPTGWADDLFGESVPPEGDPDLARRLIRQSGEPIPDLTWDYPQTPANDKEAAIVIDSLARAGINVKANALPAEDWGTAISNDQTAHEFGWFVWGYDWPTASTIIPPLFTDIGGWNLSRVHDQDFLDQVQAALTTLDRGEQAAKWQMLNREAMQRGYVISTTFGVTRLLGGTRIGALYLWSPYGSWPFAEMGVLP
jgi:peptide/nickel transport system substrate-binding protein